MVRRWLTWALAVVVLGAPVASDMCEATCAGHQGHQSRHEGASHDHQPVSSSARAAHHHGTVAAPIQSVGGAEIAPVTHVCDRLDAVTTESRQGLRIASNVPAAAVDVVSTLPGALASTDVNSRHGPPLPVRSTSPLRI